MNYYVFSVLLIILSYAQGGRILGVYPIASYSHYQLGHVIFKELAKRGHDVTVISPYEEKDLPPNYKQIVLDGVEEKVNRIKSSLYNRANYNIFQNIISLNQIGNTFVEMTLSHTTTQTFLKEKHDFDLVIYHQFFSDAYNGFCYHFKAPCVEICSAVRDALLNRQIGNPGPPSYVPGLCVNYSANMNFVQRFYNAFVYILDEAFYYFKQRSDQNTLLQTYFPNVPHLDELNRNMSLILVNSHVSINDIAPTLPNLVHIGGAHVAEPRPLAPDLQDFLDNAKEGVIFFSMGSNLSSKDIPASKRDALLKVFSRLKQKILWKWEDQILPNKPKNVKIAPWLAQRDILAHPNVVLFITHGGLMSTIEAVYSGVPVFGIPVFGDQESNMIRAELAGYGKFLPYNDFTEEAFDATLNEMLSNPIFRENALQKSKIINDQLVKPLDNAMFWIEYILRHRGAPHLRSAALNLSWYQYHSLDVLAIALLILVVIGFTIKAVIRRILNLCYAKNAKEKNLTNKKTT